MKSEELIKVKVKENVNRDFEKMLGISYDEFDKLDFDEQQRLISEYHKKHPTKKSKETLVMIGGGDESIFIRVPKGKKIWTPDGYFIAGETLEENKKRWEQEVEKTDRRFKKLNKRLDKEIKKSTKLDFKTLFYLYITQAKIVEHPPVEVVEDKRTIESEDSKKNEVYVFKNYEEYKNYFFMYLDSIENDVIDLAIYTRGSKGQIIALKGLCEQIIVKNNKIKNNNIKINSITQERIDEIHARGHITAAEKVKEWESMDLCAPGDAIGSAANRCHEFNYNCHECLVDYASAQDEYESIDLKVCNAMDSFIEKTNKNETEQGPVKKLVPNKRK